MKDCPSTDILSPTSKGCITKRNTSDSKVLRAAFPKTKTEGSNVDDRATSSLDVFTPRIRKKMVMRMTVSTCVQTLKE